MSASLRFLGLAIVAYVGLRTAGSALALEPVTPFQAAVAPTPEPAAPAPAQALPPGVPAEMVSPMGYFGFAPAYGPAGTPPGMPPQQPILLWPQTTSRL